MNIALQVESWPVERLIPRATNPTHAQPGLQIAQARRINNANLAGRIRFWSGSTTTSSLAMRG